MELDVIGGEVVHDYNKGGKKSVWKKLLRK
jgi:hypothetical protein